MLSEPSSSAELHGPGVILYDFLAQTGGAENLTQSLLNEYPNADLCVGFLEKTSLDSINTESRSIIDLEARLAVPFISTSLLIWRFKKLAPRLKKYQWLIFSGSFALFSSSATQRKKHSLLPSTTTILLRSSPSLRAETALGIKTIFFDSR